MTHGSEALGQVSSFGKGLQQRGGEERGGEAVGRGILGENGAVEKERECAESQGRQQQTKRWGWREIARPGRGDLRAT